MKTALLLRRRRACGSINGFTLIEVMFAAVILSVGMLAVLAVFARAVTAVRFTQEDQIAKQKAQEALEAVYSARNDNSISFESIRNLSNGGIFKDDFQRLYLPGANGIVGTGQDTSILDRVITPGADGLLGTGDDSVVPLNNLQRRILIENVVESNGSVNSDMRRITVTVRVTSPAAHTKNPSDSQPLTRDYAVSGLISRFR